MIGKGRKTREQDGPPGSFFGDEPAAEAVIEIRNLRARIEEVETQLHSQFTSLATYSQIAQNQVELARAEATAATERSERRVTTLIERERADRIADEVRTAASPGGADTDERLRALESKVTELHHAVDDCRRQQKELADALTALFEPLAADQPS